MRLGKASKPVHQPLGGEIGRRTDGQRAGALALKQPLGSRSDTIKGIAHDFEIVSPRLGDDQPLSLAIE